jgi:hypothetical protein
MARIPDYTAVGTELPEPYTRPFVQPDESGEIIAGAADELGRSVTQAGAAIQQKAQADAATWASNQLTDFRVQTEQAFNQARAKAPDDAQGFTDGVLADFDQRAGTLTAAARSNPLARDYLSNALPQLRAQVQENAMRWEAGQRTAFRTQSVVDNSSKLASLVQSDPSQLTSSAAQLTGQINALGLDPDQRVQLRNQVGGQLATAAAQGAAVQDPLGTLTKLGDPSDTSFPGLNPQQRVAVQSYARAQLVDQQATSISQVYANGGFQAGAAALGGLDSNKALSPDVVDEIRAKTNSLVEQLRDQRRQQFAPQLSQLEESIASGKAGDTERGAAWQLFQNGALDPGQLAGTLSSIDRSEIKTAGDTVAIAAVEKAYTSGTPLDPKDSGARDAADQYFTTKLAAGLQPGSAGYANAAVQLARKTGIVPDSAISWARANLTSGDPQDAAQSADLVARLEDGNLRALTFSLDDRTRAMADSISQAVKAGTPAPIAVQNARQLAQLSPQQTEELKQQWLATKPATTQGGALQSLLKSDPHFKPGMFSALPQLPTAMQGEFDAATQRYFNLTGGNVQQARQLAVQDLKRVWGVSDVNGKREILPYAPEVMFPGLTAADVRQDLSATVNANAQAVRRYDPETGNLVQALPAPDSIRLVPTDHTARTGGLEWQLGAPDQYGAMDVLRGADGNPLIYRLPVSQTDFDAVRTAQAEAAIGKARQLQADRERSMALAGQEERESLAVLGR